MVPRPARDPPARGGGMMLGAAIVRPLGVGGARLEGWPPPFPDATAVRGESKNISH